MAVRSKEEIIEMVTKKLDDSDESISLLEDISDTYDSFGEAKEWKDKYESNDREWRARYKERFMGKKEDKVEEVAAEEGEKDEGGKEVKTYEDLFEEKED